MKAAAEIAVGGRALLGESPVWDGATGTLVWVDILRGEIHRYDPASGRDTATRFDVPVGAALPRRDGGLVVGAGMGVALADEDTATLRWLAHADRGDRMNDAGCDPAGRLWAGTLTDDHRPGASALYRLDDGMLTRVLDVALSNGLAWSPDGETLYYTDTVTERVDAFDYDLDGGTISRRRMFADLRDTPGRPDGLTVDAEGGVWVATARGGAVHHYDPAGVLLDVLDAGAPVVTSCEFGGAELRDLYLTTSCVGLDEDELAAHPRAGALLRVRDVGVTGQPAHRFSD